MKAWLLLCLGLLLNGFILEGAEGARTLAVLSVDAGVSGNIVDEIVANLSRNGSLRLVEREAIARIIKEQEMSSVGTTASSLVALGRLLGADVLALVGKQQVMDKAGLRMLVCDASTGARIGQLSVAGAAMRADRLAEEIRAVIGRFPHGVRSAVVVPDLVSRDLSFGYAGLQSTLADLLRETLSRQQGVAVVELEEAKAIAEELELVGGEAHRIVPLFVEGEFRTDASAQGGPKITIIIKLRTAQREMGTAESGAIPLDQAGQFLLGTVQSNVLQFLHGSFEQPFDTREEFARLIGRADQFAEIGDFERSAAIREAALLLQPDSDEQRVRLVRDYVRWNRAPVEVWPKGARQTPNDPFWAEVVTRSRLLWRRSLRHVEYLVRNGRVDRGIGSELFDNALQSIAGIRAPAGEKLGEEEELRKDFIRHMAPDLIRLANRNNNRTPPTGKDFSSDCGTIENAFWRVDGNFLRKEDLELVGDLLCEILPETTQVAPVILYRLREGTRIFGNTEWDVSPEEWSKFTERLLKSNRPLVHAYGRYAQLCDRSYRLHEVSEERLLEAGSLAASLKTPPLSELDPGKSFYQASRNEANWAAWAMNEIRPLLPDRVPKPSPATAGPHKNQPDGSVICERVRLRPLNLSLEAKDNQQVQSLWQGWQTGGLCKGLQGVIPAWKGIDVVYTPGVVFFLSAKEDKARPVLLEKKLVLSRAAFDGRYLWVSGRGDYGVYAIDQDGTIAAHASMAQGLPEADIAMPLHALGKGKIMAAGSFGHSGRGWLATIELLEGLPRVNVFHEAVKAWEYRDTPVQQIVDPAMNFRPEWIIEHVDETKKRWVFVQRPYQPLVVDVDKLEVGLYPPPDHFENEYFPRMEGGPAAFWSHNGLLYVAGSNEDFKIFRLDLQTHRFKSAAFRGTKDWHYGNDTAGCLAEWEGYLYYVGHRRWLRRNLTTGEEEILVSSERSLPHYGSGGGWMLGRTETHGLLAWYNDKLYEVAIEPNAARQPKP